MTTKDLGIVRLVPKGDWSETVNYQYLNIVRYNGASYIATSASIGIAPDSSNGSTYWQLLSQDVGNAIQEELSVIENNVQNNANAIQNQGTLIQKNANDIKNLFAITAPTYTEITVDQAYASRVTADGADIFDDQLTPVLEIAGSTVKGDFIGLKHANINSIVSTGKNLFDKDSAILEFELGSQGQLVASPNWFVSDYIPVQEGKSICISGKPGTGLGNAFYDANKNFIKMINLSLGTLTVPQGARYMRFNSSQNNLGTAQIEYGSTATSYESYKESVFQLPETVGLGVFDKILPQEGKIVRRGNRVVLTGQEGWSTTGVTIYTSGLPAYTYVGRPSLPINDPVHHGGICNVGRFYPDNNTAGCYMANNGKTLYFTRELLVSIGLLTKTDNGDGTYTYGEINADVVNGWKSWLKSRYDSGDPVMVEYFVTEEYATTETINAPKWYESWNKGSETIVQGETDNSQFGAMPTVTQTYFGKVGEE